ncbi:Transposase [Halanaerobium congolense]|uniref:Transposase n=2 Tax=Halanaerobium congolense TaxID=54121 RepID=A0A1G8SBU5_9FIRM|nr:transposase [Halanaerobium congolense]TDX34785.1 transposase [Halanaerobium congolense]SDH60692.1 Transposase [Halanaerobium congolense]SDJ26653.1 Transposase [Halanaerobium congolense]
MKEMAQYNYIRFLFFNQKKSKRAIASELGIHRDTVTRAIANPEQKYRLSTDRPQPVNGDFKKRINIMVKENHEAPKGQKLTKLRMYELICEEGYSGTYSSFTYQCRKEEEELHIHQQEAYLKLVPISGSLQVDFGEVYSKRNGVPVKKHAFCAKLCSGKGEFVKAYPREQTEFFFDGLSSAFKFFGGIPKKIIFDNLKPAVKTVLKEQDRILQQEFLKIQSFYSFEAEFCGPGKGNEKGLVENLVKYVQNNYFLPRPEFISFEDTNQMLLKKCLHRLRTRKHLGETWEKRLLAEDFLPLTEIYEYARLKDVKVSSYQLVHIDTNRYSVPTEYVGKRLQARLYPFEIRLVYNDKVVAVHDRLFGKNKEILNPYHFLSLLWKKARGYDQAKVIQDWKLPEIYTEYHRLIQAHLGSKSKGTREFIDILRLTEEYSVPTIARILKELDQKNRYSYQDVLSVLRYQTQCTSGTQYLADDILKKLNIDHIHTTHLPLSEYDSLLVKGGEING